jgi:hypothetical protein
MAQHPQCTHLEEGVVEGIVVVLEEGIGIAFSRVLASADVWLADIFAVRLVPPALRLGRRPLLPV